MSGQGRRVHPGPHSGHRRSAPGHCRTGGGAPLCAVRPAPFPTEAGRARAVHPVPPIFRTEERPS